MIFTEEEKDLIIYSLQMRSNKIQTGDTTLSACDIEGRPSPTNAIGQRIAGPEIKALNIDQMKLCVQIKGLIKRIEDEA